jgi:hypothetical protein
VRSDEARRIQVQEGAGRTLRVDRTERDVLRRLVVDLELGAWASRGFELDPPDPEEQRARRVRVETAFWLLDDLGWETDDPRATFLVRVRDEDALVDALRQWRDWEAQAIEDIRQEREDGAPIAQTAPELLDAAQRMSAVARMLAQLDGTIEQRSVREA